MIYKNRYNDKPETIVCIEYNDNIPFTVYTEYSPPEGKKHIIEYVFDKNKKDNYLMFYETASGGDKVVLSQFREDAFIPVCINPECFVQRQRGYLVLDEPKILDEDGNINPFENAWDVSRTEYCTICDDHYCEDGCEDHHYWTENGTMGSGGEDKIERHKQWFYDSCCCTPLEIMEQALFQTEGLIACRLHQQYKKYYNDHWREDDAWEQLSKIDEILDSSGWPNYYNSLDMAINWLRTLDEKTEGDNKIIENWLNEYVGLSNYLLNLKI
jgi:hypothetical protein